MIKYIGTILDVVIIANQVAIYSKLEKMMASIQQFQAALAEVDAETTRIGTYLESIAAQLNRADLTDAEETTLLSDLQAAATRLKGVATSVTTPVPVEPELPPVEPVEEEPVEQPPTE